MRSSIFWRRAKRHKCTLLADSADFGHMELEITFDDAKYYTHPFTEQYRLWKESLLDS